MTDNELLELAAKAAGIPIYIGYLMNDPIIKTGEEKDGDPVIKWNPLKDDRDAFQLATKMRMTVDVALWENTVGVRAYVDPSVYEVTEYNEDITAAARRAIVRVAAAIGKHMS